MVLSLEVPADRRDALSLALAECTNGRARILPD